MKYHELKGKTEAELVKMVDEERGNLAGLKLKLSVNQMKDVRAIREARTKIAHVETMLTKLRKAA